MSKTKFDQIKKAILGSKYDLSIVFITPKKIEELNRIYRDINKPTDILSFPLSKTSGEMFICLSETRKMAKEFDRAYENFLAYLFIHGCVHLMGYDHGPKMDKIEEKFRKQFNV
jgi:probable rRNA maturation factor